MKTAYLAGPTVFLPDAIEQGARKKAICAEFGLTGLYPFDNEVDISAPDASKLIFEANVAMIRRADMVIADLTPYPEEAPSADAGTIWELGFAYGLGKPCYGYTNDCRPFSARMETYVRRLGVHRIATNIETFGDNIDNLMINDCLTEMEVRDCELASDIYHDLGAFRALIEKIIAADKAP